jgi:hypothetical protein
MISGDMVCGRVKIDNRNLRWIDKEFVVFRRGLRNLIWRDDKLFVASNENCFQVCFCWVLPGFSLIFLKIQSWNFIFLSFNERKLESRNHSISDETYSVNFRHFQWNSLESSLKHRKAFLSPSVVQLYFKCSLVEAWVDPEVNELHQLSHLPFKHFW